MLLAWLPSRTFCLRHTHYLYMPLSLMSLPGPRRSHRARPRWLLVRLFLPAQPWEPETLETSPVYSPRDGPGTGVMEAASALLRGNEK